jgi:hypothetical protein
MSDTYPTRRSIRIPHANYTRTGRYFLTICANNMHCLFGRVVNDGVVLTPLGEIARNCWLGNSQTFPARAIGRLRGHAEPRARNSYPRTRQNRGRYRSPRRGRARQCRAPTRGVPAAGQRIDSDSGAIVQKRGDVSCASRIATQRFTPLAKQLLRTNPPQRQRTSRSRALHPGESQLLTT